MEVARGKKFSLARGDPPFSSSRLAPWAVPIAATVIGDGAMSTTGAFIDMAAECGGATAHDGQQDFDMGPADPLAAAPDESNSRGADEVGQLPERQVIYPSGCDMPFSLSESRGLAVALRWRCER